MRISQNNVVLINSYQNFQACELGKLNISKLEFENI